MAAQGFIIKYQKQDHRKCFGKLVSTKILQTEHFLSKLINLQI